MRIAYLPGLFPVLSETPVVNQITGLVVRGHEVAIFADQPRQAGQYHESIDRLNLLPLARYARVPDTLGKRWRGMGELIASHHGASRTALLRSLNPFVYAGRALSGKLAYQTSGYLPAARYDIIHGGFGEQGVKALRMRRLGAIQGPIVTAFQGADITKYTRVRGDGVYRRLFRAGDLFLPVSQFFANRLLELGAPPAKTRVLRTGIDLKLFAFEPRAHSARLRLVSVGRLVEKKGIDDALHMFAKLKELDIGVAYDIIGDGPLRSSLEQLTGELGIGDRTRFLGAQDQNQLPALLATAHALLTPSVTAPSGDQEGIPNVLKEAMAVGLPVISTWHAGIPELVEQGKTGFLAKEHDPEGLTRAVRILLDNPGVWGPTIEAARKRIEDDYDIEKQNDVLVQIYRDIIASSTPTTLSMSSMVL